MSVADSIRQRARWLPVLGFACVVGVLSARRLADPDLPWHLTLGRLVVGEHRLFRVDPLSYLHPRIGYMEFVSDTLLFGIHHWLGAIGLQVLGALLAVATAWLIATAAKSAGFVRWGVAGLSLGAMGTFLLVRPATISFVLLALTLLLVEIHRESPGERRGRRAIASLVPLMLVWVNVHGFATLGLILIWLYAGYRSGCKLARGKLGGAFPIADGSELGAAWAVAIGALVVSGANLAGYGFLTAPLQAGRDFSRITEWASTTFGFLLDKEPFALGFFVIALLALGFGREPDGKRTPRGFDIALLCLGLILVRSAVRLIPVGVILIAPSMARRLGGLLRGRSAADLVSAALPLAAAGAIFVSTTSSFGVGFEPVMFPEKAVRFIERENPQGHMWNFMPFGGYLSFRLYPNHLVLADGRTGWVYDPALLAKVFASEHDPTAFAELTREHQIEWAVTRSREGERFGAPLATSKAWRMVFIDDVSAIYVRHDGANPELEKKGYHLLNHLVPLNKVLGAAISGEVPAADLAHDGDLALEQAPESARAAFLAACGAIALRDTARFERDASRLAQIAPNHPALALLRQASARAGMK